MISDPDGKVSKSEITNEFSMWYKSIHGSNGAPSSKKVHTYMDKKYGSYDKKRAWTGIRINYDNEPIGGLSSDEEDIVVDNINENDF
jgi:hypothetical protein